MSLVTAHSANETAGLVCDLVASRFAITTLRYEHPQELDGPFRD